MKTIGLLVITVGFLAGALVSVIDSSEVRWGYLVASLGLGIVGVVIARAGHHQANVSGVQLTENMQAIESSLGRIVENIMTLNAQKHTYNAYDVRHRIDELFLDDLATFVEARESIGHVHSLAAYADVMTDFAAGERYLNRVWSASADGYVDEVKEYLDKASKQFTLCLQKITKLKQDAAN
jgi:uncharacterized membrane protein YeaQ/YmgE (transglycosylase-associated protein family)